MSLLTKPKLKEVLEKGLDFNIFISDRKGRKSSVAQDFLIDEAKDGNPFIIIRSKTDENINENWLSEYMIEKTKKDGLTFWSEKADKYIEAIYFKDKKDKKYLLCYGLYLSVVEKYKSSYFKGFESVKYILWEECIPNNQLLQDTKYIRKKHMEKITNLLNVGSTIARNNRVQYILLGNDIAFNLINPITVAFNLLERISPNCEIYDKTIIDDREYSFYFNYFDFDGAVNHWLLNKELDITYDLKIDNSFKYDLLIISEFKKYYILRGAGFLYVTSVLPSGIKNSGVSFISDEVEFFKQFKAEHLLRKFPLRTALIMLQTLYNVSYFEISQYYGEEFFKNPCLQFKKPELLNPQHIINLEEITKMELSQIMKLENFEKLKMLNELIVLNTVIYENVKIKMLFEELRNIMFLI